MFTAHLCKCLATGNKGSRFTLMTWLFHIFSISKTMWCMGDWSRDTHIFQKSATTAFHVAFWPRFHNRTSCIWGTSSLYLAISFNTFLYGDTDFFPCLIFFLGNLYWGSKWWGRERRKTQDMSLTLTSENQLSALLVMVTMASRKSISQPRLHSWQKYFFLLLFLAPMLHSYYCDHNTWEKNLSEGHYFSWFQRVLFLVASPS